jgi:uncharacterized protein (DUF433 family)
MTTMAGARIDKTESVCGGDARIANTRIPVWLLVLSRKRGSSDADLFADYPTLTADDLNAAWDFYRKHPLETEQGIWFNDTAANVPPGEPPPAWVIVSGGQLGLSDEEIGSAFDPPLTQGDLVAAWDNFRADPAGMTREITRHRMAG